MFCVSLKLFSNRFAQLTLVVSVALIAFGFTSVSSQAQPQRAGEQPIFSEFKGVRIGMPAEEARKKLGSPRDKADDQDFYVFNDTQAVQVYYDKTKTVSAISIDYMNGAADIPAPRDVIGGEPDVKADGSAYKMVRYPKAGFWVSYSKTAGAQPTITVTIQKIEH